MDKGTSGSTGTSAFQKTTLSGGVRVITETIPAMRSVAVGVWIDNGSRDEEPADAGMSHFMEHMVFKGTARRKIHHIAQYLESVGGYLNAFTAKEHTCFYARVLDEHLDRAIDLLSDLVVSPSLPPKEIEREKDVVIEEMKMYEDAPEELVFDFFEDQIYRGHAMGRPVIGFEETVRAFTRDQLTHFLDTHYAQDRVVVAVAGNVRHETVVRLAEKAYAPSTRTRATIQRTEPPAHEPNEKVESRPIQQAHLVLGTRCFSVHDSRRMALTLLNTVLGGGMSSRLNQNIREKHGYCYNIYSFANLHSDTGDFGVYMGTDASKIERSKALIWRELDRLAQEKVSARMLGQARSQVKGALMLGLESMSNRMMRIGRHELYYGKFFSMDEAIEEIERTTADDIQAVAQDLFVRDRFSTTVLVPQK